MSQAPIPWTHGSDPGRQLLAFGFALLFSIAAIDHLLSGRLTFFFDLSFITLSLVIGLRSGEKSSFAAALFPPAGMLVLFVLLGIASPEMIAKPDDPMTQAVVSGFAHHSLALVVGYALCLGAMESKRRGRLVTSILGAENDLEHTA